MLTPRRAFTLLELCVALTLGAAALAIVVAAGIREQRLHLAATRLLADGEHTRQASAIAPIDLRALDPRAGDLRADVASDTMLEVRITLASGIVCAVDGSFVSLVPGSAAGGLFGSFVSLPDPGDTAWALVVDDTTEHWRPISLRGASLSRGRCPASESALVRPSEAVATQLVLDVGALDATAVDPGALRSSGADVLAPGTPVRVTRPVRYVVYRAGDRHWYLGLREWNPGSARFEVVQPVSGPHDGEGTAAGLRFRYLNAAGDALELPLQAAGDVARIELLLSGTRRIRAAIARTSGEPPESLRVTVALRNR